MHPDPLAPQPADESIKSDATKVGIAHPLFFTAFLVGGLNFCCLMIPSAVLPLIAAGAGVVVTVVAVAAWSVFGPGTYLSRMIRAHLLGCISAAGVVLAYFVLVVTNSLAEAPGPKIHLLFGVQGFLIALVSSVAAQMVFWGLRSTFGCQFVVKKAAPERSFSIADIMLFTFLIAIVLTAPQVGAWSLEFAATAPEVTDWQGLPIDTSRDEAFAFFTSVFLNVATLSFTVALFSTPLFFFCLKEKPHDAPPDSNGLAPTFFYLLILALIINLLMLPFGGLPIGIIFSLVLAAYFAFLLFVLYMMQHGNVSFTWPRRYKKLNPGKPLLGDVIVAPSQGPFE